ncbi:MAG: CarD family transcriptional regulator [Clostridiaceae bacterium]|nr:CarD family transcriptional regulator [Clostridiaceae bacterium]
MFKTGDLVVYGGNGVCRIESVAPLPGTDQEYYTLRPLFTECVIRVPVTTKVAMRDVISRGEAMRLIDSIPNIVAEAYHNRSATLLAEHYDMAFRSHNCEDLIDLTMSIYTKKKIAEREKRKFGMVDERYMKRAEELLFGELSVALGIPVADVQSFISKRIDTLKEENGQ